MARSPSDATRFTATGPYASSPPSFASAAPSAAPFTGRQIDFGSAPANETPQQKIARLRSAAQAARRGKESTFDTTVRIGRKVADRAHRFTALGLIGLTIVSGCVAAAGITDMLLHNRRRRNEWLAEQQARTARELAEAKRAVAMGMEVTEDQMLLINRERAAEEAAEAKRNRPGMFKRATSYVFGGMEKEEAKGGRLGAAAAAATVTPSAVSEGPAEGQKHDRGVLRAVEEKLDENRRQGEQVEEVMRPLGGPLDRQAQLVADSVSHASRNWLDRITGR